MGKKKRIQTNAALNLVRASEADRTQKETTGSTETNSPNIAHIRNCEIYDGTTDWGFCIIIML